MQNKPHIERNLIVGARRINKSGRQAALWYSYRYNSPHLRICVQFRRFNFLDHVS